MVRVRQAIVVEGRYDKNTLSQIVDTVIIETNGFGIMNDKPLQEYIKKVASTRGLIILTDSDSAGFQIRGFLKGILPKDQVLHAYIPDIIGKERRKTHAGKEGMLGVEGMRPDILLRSLREAGAELDGESLPATECPVTKSDLYVLGFFGRTESKQKRKKLLEKMNLPAHMSTNELVQALNVLYSRDDFIAEYIENGEST